VGKSHDSTYDTHGSVIWAFEIHGVGLGQGGFSDPAVSCAEEINVRMFIEHTVSERKVDR
jgi:hypothetical protein